MLVNLWYVSSGTTAGTSVLSTISDVLAGGVFWMNLPIKNIGPKNHLVSCEHEFPICKGKQEEKKKRFRPNS